MKAIACEATFFILAIENEQKMSAQQAEVDNIKAYQRN